MIEYSNVNISIGDSDFYDPLTPIYRWRGDLPHWEQDGKLYFVTFRLADSLPAEIVLLKLQEYNQLRDACQSTEETHLRVLKDTIDKYLDSGVGKCWLKDLSIREQVIKTLHESDGSDYDLIQYVIMPNHLHLILRTALGKSLKNIIGNIKRKSTYRINRLIGKSVTLWQREYYDYLIRNIQELDILREYIRENPTNLPSSSYHLYLPKR